MDDHDWITLHRIRFAHEIAAPDRAFPGPAAADFWRFCPTQARGPSGMPTFTSDCWGGLALYPDRASAEAVLDAPTEHLPFLDEALEQWHALLVPHAHRGEVKWRDEVQDGTAVRPGRDSREGPLVIVTTAGYVSRDPDQFPRIRTFLDGIEEVLAFYGSLPDNMRRATFNGGFDGRDGFTCSIWRNDAAMLQAAYRDGRHRELMEQSRDGSLFDRSSFTRARVVASQGSWDGDPLA